MKFIQDKDLGTYVVLNEEGDPQTHLGMTNFPEITDGDEFVDYLGGTSTFEFVDFLQLGELAISVWLEANYDIDDVEDTYTVQVFEIDTVTSLTHGLFGSQLPTAIFNVINEFHIV